MSNSLLDYASRSLDEVPPMSALLCEGGIVHDIDATTKSDVLAQLVHRLPLPPQQDRRVLLDALVAREAMGSTGIGDGMAIPHVREPIVLHVDRPFVTLGLLRHPVDFGSMDGQPVHALFVVVSPTAAAHVRILARLAVLLRDDILRKSLRRRAPAEEILGRVELLQNTRSTRSVRAAQR